MNKSGERVRDALSDLTADFERPGMAELRDASVDSFLEDGRAYAETLSAITHEDADPAAFHVNGMRGWLKTVWAAHEENQGILEGITEGMTALQARGMMRMARWARESGLSPEQASAEITRRMDSGEELPW
jgi:hypothetical protein